MKKGIIILLVLAVALSISGCFAPNPQPTVNDVQSSLDRDMEYLSIIVLFMCSTQYENIYIIDNNGMMLAEMPGDLENVKIEDNNVVDAIEYLLWNQKYREICKLGNTIYFMQWSSVHERDCGIAYSINGVDQPEIPYMTECVPLSQENWFYCFADYNLSRIQDG